MTPKRKQPTPPPEPPPRELVPIIWLEVVNPKLCANNPQTKSRRLILKTQSHSLSLSDSFGDELLEMAEIFLDQAAALRRLRDLVEHLIERETTGILVRRREQIKAGWTDHERSVRGGESKPVQWEVPEVDFFFDEPQKPHDP